MSAAPSIRVLAARLWPACSKRRPTEALAEFVAAIGPQANFRRPTEELAVTTQTLTPGRIVHYVMPIDHKRCGEVRPAIIVRPWTPLDAPTNPGMCKLQVFLDGPNDGDHGRLAQWEGSVLHDPAGNPGTWHFPPRA